MQYKETQRNHENKKREKELERIKEKLIQVLHLINYCTYINGCLFLTYFLLLYM